jgi:cytochrome P450
MIMFPEVQARCQKEIDAAIGDCPVSIEDRSNTHYLESVILEIMRHCPHMTLTVQHYTHADCTIRGLHIPKGTQVFERLRQSADFI